MGSRLELQTKLEGLLGSKNVYYQPPPSIQMNYDAIVYSRSKIDNTFANDTVYTQAKAYTVTVIYKRPDSEVVDKVSRLPKCRFDRHFVSDNLHHDVFTLYY